MIKTLMIPQLNPIVNEIILNLDIQDKIFLLVLDILDKLI